MRALRRLGLSAMAFLTAAVVPTLTAPVAQASPPDPTVSVTLALAPTDDAGLTTLAHARNVSRVERQRRLTALVPGGAEHAVIARLAGGLGLTVRRSTTWSVQVQGRASTVRALFGRTHVDRHGLTTAYSRVPTALAGYVTAALPAHGRVARPLATHPRASSYTGSDFRTAYAATAAGSGAGLTVATLQLSGWNSADLTTYAKSAGLPDPVAAGRYTAIPVDGASTSRSDCLDPNDPTTCGDPEVALDQEAILSTAPMAAQRAYFGLNDDGGQSYLDIIHQVGEDAATHHIATLSISWGGCVDPNYIDEDSSFYRAVDQALKFTVASGVTVLAATGDFGSDDCGDGGRTVDFPAASPYVVAVGGTSLTDASQPQTATAWDGSGGGETPPSVEKLPAFQQALPAASGRQGRLVPDIASDADPATGFDIFDSREGTRFGTSWEVLGGTSLAAPTQAALLTAVLSSGGFTSGIGDIHAKLYSASSAAFTDITSGSNGDYSAAPGFDLVTGLGTPLWSQLVAGMNIIRIQAPTATRLATVPLRVAALGSYQGWSAPTVDAAPADGCSSATLAAAPATVTLPGPGTHTVWLEAKRANGQCDRQKASIVYDTTAPQVRTSLRVASAVAVRAAWSASDPAPASGVDHYVVTLRTGSTTLGSVTTTGTSFAFDASAHRRYTLLVQAVDAAGNASRTASSTLADDGSFHRSSGWHYESVSSAYRHGDHYATTAGRKATFSGSGTRYVVYATTCPTCGTFRVYDSNGHRVATVDTYSARTHRHVAFSVFASRTAIGRTFTLRTFHVHDSRSRGYRVAIDGFAVD